MKTTFEVPPTLAPLSSMSVLFDALEHFRPVDEERARLAAEVERALCPPPKTPPKTLLTASPDAMSAWSGQLLVEARRGKSRLAQTINIVRAEDGKKRAALQALLAQKEVEDALCPPHPREKAYEEMSAWMGEMMESAMMSAFSTATMTATVSPTSAKLYERIAEVRKCQEVEDALCPPPPLPNDDFIDAMRYSLMSGIKVVKPSALGSITYAV
jgi:hypothetical protein